MRVWMLTLTVCSVSLLFDTDAAPFFCVGPETSRLIDTAVEKCVDGIRVKKTTTQSPVALTAPPPRTTHSPVTLPPHHTPPVTRIVRLKQTTQSPVTLIVPPKQTIQSPVTLTVQSQTHERCGMNLEQLTGGHECCGYQIYHPDFATCCFLSSTKYIVHENKTEKLHVCCDLQTYERHEAPCRRNTGSNDKLWQPERLPKKGLSFRECDPNRAWYAFVVKIVAKDERFYNVTVETVTGKRKSGPKYVRQMRLYIDKYSPTKNIVGNTFLHLTHSNGLEPDHHLLDWFIGRNDRVFKVSKRQEKRMTKKVRKLLKLCNRRRHSRRNRFRTIFG